VASKEVLERVLNQIRTWHNYSLPDICKELGLDWWGDIRVEQQTNPWFQEELKKVSEEMKYSLLAEIAKVAHKGKVGRANHDYRAIQFVIQLLDEGILLGKMFKAEEAPAAIAPAPVSVLDDNDLLSLGIHSQEIAQENPPQSNASCHTVPLSEQKNDP